MKLNVKPDEILPGDTFTPTRGACAGRKVRVVDVLQGRYSTYKLKVLPLEPLEHSMDYTEMACVERPGEGDAA
jgi:hypothetical protein